MFDLSVWIACILLEALLLIRSLRGGYFFRYPIFFSYLSFVLMQSLFRFLVFNFRPAWYRDVYWFTEFVGVIAGCSVVFEFFRFGLNGFPGVARLARTGLIAAFLFTFSKVLFTATSGSDGWTPALTYLLERDMRFVQLAAVLIVVAVFFLYDIPTSRNLKGIILGYGLYLVSIVLNLTYLGAFGERVGFVVARLQAFCYLVPLLVWNVALWSYQPAPERADRKLASYSSIREETDKQLARTKTSVERALNP